MKPLLLSIIISGIMTAIIVFRFEQRMDAIEQVNEAKFAGLSLRLNAEIEIRRRADLTLERHHQQLNELQMRVAMRGRELTTQGQDFSRLIGEILGKLEHR